MHTIVRCISINLTSPLQKYLIQDLCMLLMKEDPYSQKQKKDHTKHCSCLRASSRVAATTCYCTLHSFHCFSRLIASLRHRKRGNRYVHIFVTKSLRYSKMISALIITCSMRLPACSLAWVAFSWAAWVASIPFCCADCAIPLPCSFTSPAFSWVAWDASEALACKSQEHARVSFIVQSFFKNTW